LREWTKRGSCRAESWARVVLREAGNGERLGKKKNRNTHCIHCCGGRMRPGARAGKAEA
jgi:hypothetical protein